MENAIRIQTESAAFCVGRRPLVEDISLTIRAGESVAIIGPNGSGKTTLLRLLTGARRATAGRVLLDGKLLQSFSRPEIACQIAYMPQNTFTDFDIRAGDAVAMGRFPHIGAFRAMTSADAHAVKEAMAAVGVESLANRSLPTLSAGERQRVFLARSLAQGSPILILDEPISSLDIGHQIEFIEILQKLHSEGKTILAAIHDLRLAYEHFPRAVLLDHGRVTADGPTRDVITSDAARDAFHVKIDINGEFKITRG